MYIKFLSIFHHCVLKSDVTIRMKLNKYKISIIKLWVHLWKRK